MCLNFLYINILRFLTGLDVEIGQKRIKSQGNAPLAKPCLGELKCKLTRLRDRATHDATMDGINLQVNSEKQRVQTWGPTTELIRDLIEDAYGESPPPPGIHLFVARPAEIKHLCLGL